MQPFENPDDDVSNEYNLMDIEDGETDENSDNHRKRNVENP